MPVSDLMKLGTAGRLTSQQAADMALAEDRLARAAMARGNLWQAAQHRAESDALCDAINGKAK